MPISASPDRPISEIVREAIRAFVVKRDDSLTVIAGYPWFLDWGRDTLIFLRGMIAAGMLEESREILATFAKFERGGTLPNMIRGGDDSNRETSDAPLWFAVAAEDLAGHIGMDEALGARVSGGKPVGEALRSIAQNYRSGTENGICSDPASGLVFSPSHYTWMDTNYPAGTPREGYPVEIQALWAAALRFVGQIEGGEWGGLAEQVRQSIAQFFTRPGGWLSDCLHIHPGGSAAEARADDHLRPNQLFAVTLGAVDDPRLRRGIVRACEQLLTPGGMRSLADRRVAHPLPVFRDGHLLNDPANPYAGRYGGDEDTQRKPAYHNGTSWMWPFPSFPEALFLAYGEPSRAAARDLLGSAYSLFDAGCLGHLPEIADGDAPHDERGCGAQAWSVSEWYRVYARLAGSAC
ncbi:MAG: amylo-alpha-1,6-glucosidase [Verrucomicrobiales bacterium]